MKTLKVIIVVLLLLQVASAKTIIVPADEPTIQSAVNAAAAGDTVVVADGIYTGDGNNTGVSFSGKEIVVKSQNGPSNCIIDCENGDMAIAFVFNATENVNCVVEGFTIKNGDMGFWIYANSSPTIAKNIIEGCGVGIYCSSEAAPVIIGNTIRNNNNDGPFPQYGGGISLSWSAATIVNNFIYENASEKGGGIFCSNSPSATITNNTIIDNAAVFGGGVYLDKSPIILTNNIIAFSKYKPALNLNIYGYDFKTHLNYEGAKLVSIDYMFAFHNKGNDGLVILQSTSSAGGKSIDSTFQILAGERRNVHIKSRVNQFGDFGGINLVITLNNETLIFKEDGPGYLKESFYLTLAMDSDVLPASKEIIEIGQNSEITFCDIFGNEEGNYYSGESDFELEHIVLDWTNGNFAKDPMCSYPDYILANNSPCIDAGNPDASFNDFSRPPGMGAERCDIGATGGPVNYTFNISTSVNQLPNLPSQMRLDQNYPNPFNPSTQIKFAVKKTSYVTLKVYDILGRLVATLVEQNMLAGNYNVEFHAKNMASGTYMYQIQIGDYMVTKKMSLGK
jgi:parallel beta-helix repeat protein